MLERIVPADMTIAGYTIPAGATVGTQAYSVHRIKSIFPDPEEFKPERWLEETEDMRVRTSISYVQYFTQTNKALLSPS